MANSLIPSIAYSLARAVVRCAKMDHAKGSVDPLPALIEARIREAAECIPGIYERDERMDIMDRVRTLASNPQRLAA